MVLREEGKFRVTSVLETFLAGWPVTVNRFDCEVSLGAGLAPQTRCTSARSLPLNETFKACVSVLRSSSLPAQCGHCGHASNVTADNVNTELGPASFC